MTNSAQRSATANHRKRIRAKGLVRVEVHVPAGDAALLRELADRLRAHDSLADATRSSLKSATGRNQEPQSALDIYGSDLPDEYFDGVFEPVRTISGRKIDL